MAKKSRRAGLSLAVKFYLTLAPLVGIAIMVILLTRSSLQSNSQDLVAARRVKELAVQSLALLLTQDDASKALLIDMQSVDASQRKIGAYDEAKKTFAEMKQLTHSAELHALMRDLEEMDDKKLRPIDTRVLESMGEGKADAARDIYFKEYEPIRARYEATLRKLGDAAEQAAATEARRMEEVNQRFLTRIITVFGIGFLVVALIMLAVIRHVHSRLSATTALLEREATTTGRSSAVLSSSSRELAHGVSEVVRELDETGASLREVVGMTVQNAKTCANANQLAKQARAVAEKGASDMGRMSQALDDIKTASAGISNIIKTIDTIAFQTNILALNAAVEAARAGEAGLGFAVVADEVRRLAQRSAQAARETTQQIQDSIEKSERGVLLGSQITQNFTDIMTQTRSVEELVADIATASQTQSERLSGVDGAVQRMEATTHGNAEAAERGAAATEELSGQAETLTHAVRTLRSLLDGRSLPSPSTPNPTPTSTTSGSSAKNQAPLHPASRLSRADLTTATPERSPTRQP